jgi:prevent-host-death family protein
MPAVNIHDAKTHFSRLIERAAAGESIVIAKAGVPVARLVPLEPSSNASPARTGFLMGRIQVPDDFDHMFDDEIQRSFDGDA